ncbi:MAG TPA: NrsF family protein [Bryobacteraceae bacterium]|nr:NrsF family protein [Bryobacteraceae bacterium]
MRDGEIDDILKKAADARPGPDPALLDRIAGSIQPGMRPVRPLPSARALELLLYLAALAISVIVAAKLGLHGFAAMSGPQILILAAIPILIARATVLTIGAMTPGSKAREAPLTLFGIACASLVALFAILFRDPLSGPFVAPGLACLSAGVITAIPVGLAAWWLLHRGFVVNLAGAGLAAGTLAGLAGVVMLELHCPNFQTAHVIVWHMAVVPVSAALGLLAAKLVQIRRAHRRAG